MFLYSYQPFPYGAQLTADGILKSTEEGTDEAKKNRNVTVVTSYNISRAIIYINPVITDRLLVHIPVSY